MKFIWFLFMTVMVFMGGIQASPRLDMMSEVQLAMDTLDDYTQAMGSSYSRVSFEEACDRGSYDAVIKHHENEVAKVKTSLRLVIDMMADETKPLTDILTTLLEARLEDSYQRTQRLHAYFGERDKDKLVVPTLDYFYQRIAIQDAVNDAMKRSHQDGHEIVERLICKAFWACDPANITGKALEFLEMSPQLWPRLARETTKCLNADMCGGYAPIKKLWDLMPADKRSSGNAAYVIAEHIWPAYLNPVALKDLLSDAAREEYLAFRQSCDSEIYGAYKYPRKMQFLKDATLGAKKEYKIIEMLEGGYWPVLQMPLFLQRLIDAGQGGEEDVIDLGPSLFDVSLSETAAAASGKSHKRTLSQKLKPKNKIPTQPIKRADHVEGHVLVEFEGSADSAFAAAITHERHLEETKRGLSGASPASGAGVSSPRQADKAHAASRQTAAAGPARRRGPWDQFVYPQGLRGKYVVHHPMQLISKEMRIDGFLETLFDPERCLSLSFEDVRQVWEENIKGKVDVSGGGSHRTFIAPDDRKLWGSYDHGGFGKKTIKYIQALFHWAGAAEYLASRSKPGRGLVSIPS